MSYNINAVDNHLCLGCGICEDVCPKKCISIKEKHGENRPEINDSKCIGEKCGRCLKVCPGIGTNIRKTATELFGNDNIQDDKYIGLYVALHTGYSTDNDIRFHSASGGMVSQFLIYLLEKHIIDGAVVTGFANDNITPHSFIARSKEDVIAAKSSKYCPVSLNGIGNEITQLEGRFVIVGLPCHIQGFRKRAAVDRKFREKVVGMFSIYCSSNRTFNARDYIFRKLRVRPHEISYFAFRDNGCLGNLVVARKEVAGREYISIPFISYYGALRSFFKPHRCLTCIDHYGALADVCFGDIYIKPYSEDKVGVSSWIVRKNDWEKLFQDAAKEGYIKMENLDADTLNKSQETMLYPKQRKARAVMNMDKLIGRNAPDYGQQLENPSAKDYLTEIICHIQRFIGRHRILWNLIDIMGRR